MMSNDIVRNDTVRHGLVASRVLAWLAGHLPAGLEVAAGLTIVANGRNRQPDVTVFAPPPDQGAPVVPMPVLVVEVVSSATKVIDRFDKNVDYARTPSIQHYLMLADDRQHAVLCSRVGDGWLSVEKDGSETVPLPAVSLELPLHEVYRRVVFPAEAP